MKVTIVHDAFVQTGGGERVAAELVRVFGDAPLYTSAVRREVLPPFLHEHGHRTSFVQPLVERGVPLPALAALLPAAFSRLDIGQVDAVVSSSSAFAHHIRAPAGAAHVCYCHTPPRFLWDAGDYFRSQRARRALTSPGRALYRRLDLAAARRIDLYVANSRHVAARIGRVYGREALVVYPPVEIARFAPIAERSGRFLVVSRLRNQKRIDLAIAAANLAGLPLDIIGDGTERAGLERLAGPTVRFLGPRGDDEVRAAMARSAGVLVPAIQDFGLTLVEAQASGRPPIAFAAGGAIEVVEDGRTGFLFDEQTPESLVRAMRRALQVELAPDPLLASAARFDVGVFRAAIRNAVAMAVEARQRAGAVGSDPRLATPAFVPAEPGARRREPARGI